jgi:hypothetical protein
MSLSAQASPRGDVQTETSGTASPGPSIESNRNRPERALGGRRAPVPPCRLWLGSRSGVTVALAMTSASATCPRRSRSETCSSSGTGRSSRSASSTSSRQDRTRCSRAREGVGSGARAPRPSGSSGWERTFRQAAPQSPWRRRRGDVRERPADRGARARGGRARSATAMGPWPTPRATSSPRSRTGSRG